MHYCVRWAPSCPQKVGHSSAYFLVHVCCGQRAGWIKVSFGMEVDLGPGHTVLDGDPAPPPKSGAQQRLLFGPCLLWTNGWMDQGVTWYGGRPWPWPHCVTWGPSSPAQPPIFGPCPLWLNGCMDQEGATWYGRRSRPRRDCVRCGPSSHSQKGGGAPSPMFWIVHGAVCYGRVPRPGHIVLDGDLLPQCTTPIFGPSQTAQRRCAVVRPIQKSIGKWNIRPPIKS